MNEPLKYKAEKTVAAFLEQRAGIPCHCGQNPNQPVPPCILVYTMGQSESFPASLPKDVRLTVEIVSPMDGDSDGKDPAYSRHRETTQHVEERLQDCAALQLFANADRPDRPVTGFHVYDINEDSQQSTMSGEDRMFISVIGITLTCEAQDNPD